MLLIPFQISPTDYNVFIVLEDENLQRMQKYDPAQMDITKFMPEYRRLKLNVVIIGYANAVDAAKVQSLAQSGKAREALALLNRGFEFRPDLGDHDEVYTPIAAKPFAG